MSAEHKTNIEVFTETWQRLQGRKTGPGDSFDDVINRVVDRVEEIEGEIDEDTAVEDKGAADATDREDLDPVDEIIEEWSPQRYNSPDEKKREVGRQALELLRDRGEAYRSMIRDAKGEQLPDPDVTDNTFWQTYVRRAFKQGIELGYVELDENAHPQTYRWIEQ